MTCFFHGCHAALMLTSVPVGEHILYMHLAADPHLCIFDLCRLASAVSVYWMHVCLQISKGLFVGGSLSPQTQKNNGRCIPRSVWLGREPLHPGPLRPIWRLNWTLTGCSDTVGWTCVIVVSRPQMTLWFFLVCQRWISLAAFVM